MTLSAQTAKFDWKELNKNYLMNRIECIRLEIELNTNLDASINENTKETLAVCRQKLEKSITQAEENNYLTQIEKLSVIFQLTPFEQNILLMTAGMELSSDFRKTIEGDKRDGNQSLPTFGLAMSVFENAHWSALLAEGPLRYWQLIQIVDSELLTASSLKISESVLHFLIGLSQIDQKMIDYLMPVNQSDLKLTPSQHALAEKLEIILRKNDHCICLKGSRSIDKFFLAKRLFSQLEHNTVLVSAVNLPRDLSGIRSLSRLINRECAMHKLGILLECESVDPSDVQFAELLKLFISGINSLLIIGVNNWIPDVIKPVLSHSLDKPTSDEQLDLWKNEFSSFEFSRNGYFDSVVTQFNLNTSDIIETSQETISNGNTSDPELLKRKLWKRCLEKSRPRLSELAQQIIPCSGYDDLILPEAQKEILASMVKSIKSKRTVFEHWGFSSKNNRGLGISGLFAGESGTGKTMAAEVLARELQLDLFRIDLSQVVNKYIGETEKNLKRIFDAAEHGGTILLFDEADALFGKRSDVKDSHDRYANVEVSYLLQRMEEYSGLAILTTNMKNVLDKAFLRRIKFIVQFPFPDQKAREAIWKGIFPENTPLEAIDFKKLGKLNISGGNIKNIAINSAFLAAHEKRKISMDHIRKAAQQEYSKMEKQIGTTELF